MKRSPIFLIIVVVFGTTIQAQSLADFARQERERKRNIESKVTLTNDSLRAAPATTPSIASPAPAVEPEVKKDEKTAETKPAAPATKPVRDEKYWRAAFAQAREELKRAEEQVKAAEIRVNGTNKDLLQRSDIYNKEQQVGAEINKANAELDTARKSVEQAKQRISALEEELRRSGGPAGWAR